MVVIDFSKASEINLKCLSVLSWDQRGIYDFWFFVTGKCDLASQKRVVASKQTLRSLIQLDKYNAIQCKSNFNLMTYFCVQSNHATLFGCKIIRKGIDQARM